MLFRPGDVALDGGQHVVAGDPFAFGQQGTQVVGDHLPGQVDLFDDVEGLAVLVDEHPAGRGFGLRGFGNAEQGHVGPLLDVAIDEGLDGAGFEILVAHGHQDVVSIADSLKGFGGDLGGVSCAELRFLVDVEDAGMFLAHRFDHLIGPRADHDQKAAEAQPLEQGDLAVDGGDGIDLEADFDQVAAAHAGAFARSQEDDHGLFGDAAVGLHGRTPWALPRGRL